MKSVLAILIIVILFFITGIFIGTKIVEPEVIENTVTDTITVYIESEPIIKWKTAYVTVSSTDTVIVNDTVYVEKNLKIASDSTEFDEGKLKTWYFFPLLIILNMHGILIRKRLLR